MNYEVSPCPFLITDKSEEIELLTGLFCCQFREQTDCRGPTIRNNRKGGEKFLVHEFFFKACLSAGICF